MISSNSTSRSRTESPAAAKLHRAVVVEFGPGAPTGCHVAQRRQRRRARPWTAGVANEQRTKGFPHTADQLQVVGRQLDAGRQQVIRRRSQGRASPESASRSGPPGSSTVLTSAWTRISGWGAGLGSSSPGQWVGADGHVFTLPFMTGIST